MEKRCSFELFKSNVCHRLKEQGDIDFLIETLKEDMMRQYYDKKWYPESFYLLAMVDYISRENNVPIFNDYNDSAQKTPAVRKNVRGMNAPITNNATIIPTGFSSGIVGFSWPDVLQNAVIRCIALLFQEKHFR